MAQNAKNVIVALLLCMVMALAACQEAAKNETHLGRLPTVGILIDDVTNIYISLVRDNILKELDGKANVKLLSANGDGPCQKQQLESLLREKVDGLLIHLVTPQGFPAFLDMIVQADVPVVFFNRDPDLALLKRYDKSCHVGANAVESGMMQGEIIASLWGAHPEYDRNGDGKFQYVMLQGLASSAEALHRSEYSIRKAQESGLFMEQVGQSLVCDWLQEEAFIAMKGVLANGLGDIEIIISNNDAMALGAIEALAAIGYNTEGGPADKFIPVVGVDAVPEAVAAIDRGVMSATVRQDAAETARVTVACLLNSMVGKDFLDGLDKEWDMSGVAIRLPFKAHATPTSFTH